MHFHCEVWIKTTTTIDQADQQVTAAMLPYDENQNEEAGFWDWWQIGGRWTGTHDEYDPNQDPRNVETCKLCNGTGFRQDPIGLNTRQEDPSYTCNSCGERDEETGKWTHGPHGPGRRVKWPTQWARHEGDIALVHLVSDELTCYSLVVRDQVFHKEVWDGDDLVETEFDGRVVQKLKELGVTDGFLVTVDYHT